MVSSTAHPVLESLREMVAEDSLDFVVANFSSLENQFLACMEYIPFISRNMDTVSPKFVPLLIETCSLIESIFRYMARGKELRNFREFSKTYEESMGLDEAASLFLVSPMQIFQPFKNWTIIQPDWWSAYNRVKHDRIGNYHEATYMLTAMALVGLHQVIARSWIFRSNLVKAAWFNQSDGQGIADLIVSCLAGSGPPELPVETKIIVSPNKENFVDWNGGSPRVSWEWNFSERVKNYIWEHEGW